MDTRFIKKLSCPNCSRVNNVLFINIGSDSIWEKTNWKCEECKFSFDARVWQDSNDIVYQMALGSATVSDLQNYNNQNFKVRA